MINRWGAGDDSGRMFALGPSAETGSAAPRVERDAIRLQQMVEDYWVSLGRILRSLGVPEAEIDDAIQQAYIVAAEKLAAIELGKERAFLTQVAVHIAARVRRSRGRSRETATADVDFAPSETLGADDRIDHERALAMVVRIIETMPDDLREVFVLHDVEEMTMAEIAVALELAPGTVASRLRRAREEFSVAAARMRRAAERGPR